MGYITDTPTLIQWQLVCKQFQPTALQTLIETFRFNVTRDFDEKNKSSFIHLLKDEKILKHIHHLQFLFHIDRDYEFYELTNSLQERDPLYKVPDICQAVDTFLMAKKQCPNIKTLEFDDNAVSALEHLWEHQFLQENSEHKWSLLENIKFNLDNFEGSEAFYNYYLKIAQDSQNTLKSFLLYYNFDADTDNFEDFEEIHDNDEDAPEQHISFDSLVKQLQLLENIKELDFIAVGREQILEYDSILNKLPEQLTALNFTMKESPDISFSVKQASFDKIITIKQKVEKLGLRINPNIDIKRFNALLDGANLTFTFSLDSLMVCSDKEIMPLLNIKTLHLKIDLVNCGFTPEYLIQKFPNVKKLTVSGEYTRQELILLHEDVGSKFVEFLANISEYDIGSLCINNKGIDSMIKYLAEKHQNDVVYQLNFTYSDHGFYNNDYASIAIRKEASCVQHSLRSNSKKVITYNIQQHEGFISNLNELISTLGPNLISLCINCNHTSCNFSFDEEIHLKHIYATCTNLENLEIRHTEEGYYQDQFDIFSYSVRNKPIKPLLSVIGAQSFGAYMGSLSELDVEYLHISNNGFYSMMKQFLEKQKDNAVYRLNLIYSAEHNNNYTSVGIYKKKLEGNDSTRVIECDVHQNENLIGYNSNELLTTLGPYLDALKVDMKRTSPGLSFDLEHIYTTCNKLCSLTITQPDDRYYELTTKSSSESMLIQYDAYLSNILELDINNLCISNNDFILMMKQVLENQGYDTLHHLNLKYSPTHSSEYTSIDIFKKKPKINGSSSSKGVIIYNVCQNEEFIYYANELMVVLGPHLAKLTIDSGKATLHNSVGFSGETSLFKKVENTVLELSKEAVYYWATIPELDIENLHFSHGEFNLLEELAKIHQHKATQHLELTYFDGKPRDWNYVKISKTMLPPCKESESNEEGESVIIKYSVSLSRTCWGTRSILKALGPYLTTLDAKFGGYTLSGPAKKCIREYVKSIWTLGTKYPISSSLSCESDIDSKRLCIDDKGLDLLKEIVEKWDKKATQCLNLVYCDDKSKNLNSIHIHEGESFEQSKNVVTYTMWLNKTDDSDTKGKVLKVLGSHVADVNIRFEGVLPDNYSFNEESYLACIFGHFRLLKNLKVKSLPPSSNQKQSANSKRTSHETIVDIAKKLAQIESFEIEQYPLSNTMIQLKKGFEEHTRVNMESVQFDDIIAGVAMDPYINNDTYEQTSTSVYLTEMD